MAAVTKWVDVGVEGAQVALADYVGTPGADGVHLCVHRRGGLPPVTVAALAAAGFRPSPENPDLLGRPGRLFTMADLRAAFPAVRLVDADASVLVPRVVRKPAPFPRSPAPAATATPSPPPPRPAPADAGRPTPRPARIGVPSPAIPSPVVAARPTAVPATGEGIAPVPAGARTGAAAPPDAAPPPDAASASPAVDAPDAGRAPAKAAKPARRAAAPSRPSVAPPVADDVQRPVASRVGGYEDPEQVNPFQRRYVPASRVGSPIATIPLNLATPTLRALDRVERAHGPVDAFVADRLGWTIERMGQLLSPEQVDAVALALHSAMGGKAFVLADMTGLGKGRVLAAIARGVALTGETVVFITEKENLFSDFWRDVVDIDSAEAFGRPLMVNDGAQVVDTSSAEGVVIHAAWRKREVTEFIRRRKLPEGCRLVMASYSQFNKLASPKAEFLKAIVKGRQLVCDECHNAVGDSATSENLAKAMDEAASVTFSSATFARHAQNLAAYKRLFPPSMRSSDVMDVLKAGGQAISEALSQMLAEEGSYLRREHDMSALSIAVRDDMRHAGRNQALADALAPILARVARLSREVTQHVEVLNTADGDAAPKKRRELYTAGNFGSRLGLVARQFFTALLVDYCIECAVDDLSRGEKPVVVLETTMETLMRELASDDPSRDGDEAADEAPGPDTEALDAVAGDPAAQPGPPTFRDALRLLVDRTMQVSVRRGRDDPEKVPVDLPDLVAEAAAIKAMVETYPEISLSPIDDIRDGIERAGRERGLAWSAEEVSARGMRVVDGAYQARPAQDRVATVARFNAGVHDALVLTRAASTGLSLHASEKFKDQRPRHMIELQIPSNVVERMQFLGRVKRRGEVCPPRFSTLSTGLPIQNRTLAVQNRKMADLSANVTASARSATAMEVPDIIDDVGNKVAKRYLEENPRVADDMHIAMRLKDMEAAEAELYHVNKLLQRLILLPSADQDRVYREVVAAYDDAVREMRATGRSPRGAREMDGTWRIVSRDVFEPGEHRDGEVFGRPVTITTIETSRDRRPLTQPEVEAMARASEARLASLKGARPGQPFAAWEEAIVRERPAILNALLRGGRHAEFEIDYKAALRSQRPNAVQEADRRLMGLRSLVMSVRPGSGISVKGEDGHEQGVVVDVRAPHDIAQAHQPGRWSVRYVVPGDEAWRELSAAAIIRGSDVSIDPGGGISVFMARAFASSRRGEVPERRRVLDGNPVRAVIAARRVGWGSHAVWRDGEGRLNRSILVPRSAPLDLDQALDGRTGSPEAALAVLEAGGRLWTNLDRPEAGARIEFVDTMVQVEVPADRRIAATFETDRLKRILGEWKGAGQGPRWADAPRERARDVVRALLDAGHAFGFDGRHRPDANRATAEPGRRARRDRARAEPEPEPAGPRM